MGGKRATTTSKVTIPPEVLERYNAVNTQAAEAAKTPYEAFGNTASDYVAQMNAQQYAGIADINAKAGSYQPYLDQATSATQSGMGPAYAGIDNYMSPYIKNVADTTGAYMRQQQEQAQSGALGTAAMSGAFGGDRAGIAAANLQQQNQMGYGKTMADIMNQGYTQALGASQADLARQLQGGSQMAELGAQSQKLGLQGAQAKIAAGTMEQQTEQAGKDAMINQFMQEKGYPFQVAQFLANIAMGTGAASGSTTSTTTPRNWMGFADGGGVSGPRTYSQGQIGGQGYVPVGDLPVGQLMVADPPQQGQSNGMDEMIKIIQMVSGMASGGVAGGRHGYATDGSVEDLGNRIRLDDLLIEQFGGVKPVVSDKKNNFMQHSRYILGTNPQYPGSKIYSPLTTEQLRDNINDPDYYDKRGYENARNLANARNQAETNPANMGYGDGYNFGMGTRVHSYPQSPTTGVAAPSPAAPPTFTPPNHPKITLNPDGSSFLTYRDGLVIQRSKDQTDAKFSFYGTTAEEVRASQTPASAAPTTTGVVARQPNAAFQLSSEEIAANRAMMARSLGAREPRANERYMLPTGLSRPPSEALETLDFGAMLNAEDTTPVPVPATANVPGGVVPASSGPTMVDMEPVYSDIFGNITRDTRGNLYAENGTRMITDSDEKNIAAAQFNAEMKRRNLVAEQKVFEAGDSPLFLGDAYQAGLNVADAKEAAAQAQANLNGLPVQRPNPYSFFDVPQNGMPAAPPPRYQIPTSLGSPTAFGLPPGPPPTTGVVTPAMTTRPGGGVQQPMAFTAGEKPSYTLPTGLGTPPSNDLAPTTSPRPQLRPADLGTQLSTSGVNQAVPVVTSAVPAVDTNGVAGPEQTGVYTGVAGAGAGWVDLTRPDGSVEHRTGARNWRNNNPGNIEYGKLAQQYGAIGTDGRFAIFPDEQTGRNAMKGLLFDSGVYQGMTIASALNKYSPPSENDTEGKIRDVVAETGLDPNTPLDQMTPQQRDAFVLAIQRTEGPMKGDVGASKPYTTSQVSGLGGADMARQRDGIPNRDKPYKDRNFLGKFFRNQDGSLNTNALLSVLMGVGKAAEAQTISPLGGILSGIGGGAEAYKGLTKQAADVAQTQALTRQTDIQANAFRFFKPEGGVAMVTLPDGRTVKYWDLMRDQSLQAAMNPQDLASIKSQAEAAGETTPPTASGNSIFTDATGKAILANEASYVEGPGYDMAIQTSTQTRMAVNADAASARGMHDNTVEQLRAVSSMLDTEGAGSAGAAGSARAQIVKYANTILGSLGLPRVSELDTDADVLGKIRTAAGLAQANGADQNSVQALEMIANGMPNENITSQANAIIMSNILVQQQRAMDKDKLYSDFSKETPYGTVFGASDMFSRLNQKYDIERDALEKLVKVGGTKGTDGVSIMERLTSGELSPQEAQSLIAMALGGEAPTADMYRYFIPYQVKG